jgi:hypothetical protein
MACECCASDGGPYNHGDIGLTVVHEVELRCMRDELVERQQDEVGAVVHEHRPHPVHRRARRDPHHRFLGQGRIEHTVGAEPRGEILRRAEHG